MEDMDKNDKEEKAAKKYSFDFIEMFINLF
jgi:hypothetical protein